MSDRFSYVIRAGFDNGDEEELGCYDDEGSALDAFSEADCEADGKEYGWMELVKIDWYMHCDTVVETKTLENA